MKKSIFGEFRALLNYAVRMEYLIKNPLTAVGNFRDAYETKKEMDFYTADEFKKFKAAALKQAEEVEKKSGSIFEWYFYVFFNNLYQKTVYSRYARIHHLYYIKGAKKSQ